MSYGNIIDGMYENLRILEKELKTVSILIHTESDEQKKTELIKNKQNIYNKICRLEDEIGEAEYYDEP